MLACVAALAALAVLAALFAIVDAQPAGAVDTAPPSAKQPGAGKILFNGDFEPGNVSQWWGAQCANTSSAPLLFTRGTITVQSEIAAQGRYAARFDLPAATNPTACEAVRKRRLGLSEEWYALEFRLPLDWRKPSPTGWGAAIAQLNYQAIWGSPLGIYAHADRVSVVLQSGLCRPVGTPHPRGPGCANTSGPGGNLPPMYVIPTAPALGVWHQVLLHVRWAANRTGRLQVFHRRRGRPAWQQRLKFSGKPTVQWTTTVPPRRRNTTIDKIGAYRGHSTAPLSIWHDNFCVATTHAAAESCFD
jgi:Polysaccharide lyase